MSAGYHQVVVNLDCSSPAASRPGAHPAPLEPIGTGSGLTEINLAAGQPATLDIVVFRPSNV